MAISPKNCFSIGDRESINQKTILHLPPQKGSRESCFGFEFFVFFFGILGLGFLVLFQGFLIKKYYQNHGSHI